MNKVLLLVISYFVVISSAFSIQLVEIYTYDVLPPYAYKNDQGELTGVYVEIVKTAVSRMPEYSLSFQVVPWARAKEFVKLGSAFAILPPYFHAHDWLTDTEPKRPYIWPYSLPLYTQQDIVLCNAKVLQQPRNRFPEDYEGLTFVMWRGDGRADAAFEKMVKDKKIELHLVKSIEDSLKTLLFNRYDCTITSKLPSAWYIAQLKKNSKYRLRQGIGEIEQAAGISTNEGFLGYTDIDAEKNFPYKKDFSIKFDIEIYKMKQSGELDDIVKRFVDHKVIQ